MEDSGYFDLYFGDESHFGLTPNVPYAWQTKENQILLPAAKGKFLNVVGLMNRKNDLFYEVLETAFNSDKLISFMDRFALQINKKTVVILDNSPNSQIKEIHQQIGTMERKRSVDLLFTSLFPRTKPDRNSLEKNQILLATLQLLSLFFKISKNVYRMV